MSTSLLNSIWIGLTIRYPTGEDKEYFHWLLWVVPDKASSGLCLHACNRAGSYEFESKPFSAQTSQSMAMILRIGGLGGNAVETIVQFLRQTPMQTPTEDAGEPFNCRIWVREAVRVLRRKGLLQCSDIDALEKEALKCAYDNREKAERGGGLEIYNSKHSK